MATLKEVLLEGLGWCETDHIVTQQAAESMAGELADQLAGKVLLRADVIKKLESQRDFDTIKQRFHRDGHEANPAAWQAAVDAVKSMP